MKKVTTAVALLAAAGFSMSTIAEEITLTLEGDVVEASSLEGFDIVRARAVVVYDDEVEPALREPYDIVFYSGLTSIEFTFFDAEGQEIDIGMTPIFFDDPSYQPEWDRMRFFEGFSGDYGGEFEQVEEEPVIDTAWYNVYLDDPEFGETEIYVDLYTAEDFANEIYGLPQGAVLYENLEQGVPTLIPLEQQNYDLLSLFLIWNDEYDIEFEILVDTLIYSNGVGDADGDGVPDELDSCPASATDETVMFRNWYDSSVTNYVDESGCTIMDHYAKCEPAEQEEISRFSRFQPRYSGPSYCEKQVSYGLVDEGIIDYTEARMLRDALYMSYRSQPR
ncbi:thrombospondin type 3 repeat-containing protein [Pseudidiomarina salilacus]|uniref:thrombospondin type 3 repeat-containing protein n=1 Tax=Pseudidiomarina salilacus TaxID=3384452 RepID=UPI003984E588